MRISTPLIVQRSIKKFGSDLALARRRRGFSQQSLAERIGSSLSTVRRLEDGDERIPLHFVVRALQIFGELDSFTNLLDTRNDEIGLSMMDEQLPKRVRASKKTPTGAL